MFKGAIIVRSTAFTNQQPVHNPGPVMITPDGVLMWEMERIGARRKDPQTGIWEYEVKWRGYDDTTWEPQTSVQDTDLFVRKWGGGRSR